MNVHTGILYFIIRCYDERSCHHNVTVLRISSSSDVELPDDSYYLANNIQHTPAVVCFCRRKPCLFSLFDFQESLAEELSWVKDQMLEFLDDRMREAAGLYFTKVEVRT